VAVRGRRYSECRLETYEAASQKQKDAVCKLHEYASDIEQRIKDGQNVLLFGPAGTGKDHLLVALSRVAYRAGYTVAWANGQDLFSALRDAMDEGTTEKRTLRDFTNGDIQYISDPLPPVGDAGKWQQETLFRIIDRCYSNLRPVWVTLNVKDKQEAQQRLGVQTTDRLMHGALIIPCNWESYRKPF
jgi:DNA replication protein DnaC